MIYNPGSKVSLISEYQVRSHGCIVDSVAKGHRMSLNGEKGTQTFYPRDDYPIPLTLMKGLMGFRISEPTDKELETLEHIVITSDTLWTPQKYVDDHDAIEFQANIGKTSPITEYKSEDVIPRSDLYLYDPSDNEVIPVGETIQVPLLGTYPLMDLERNVMATTSWHRTTYSTLDPTKIQPYLAYRPLEVVKRTLENMTQLAKMIVRFPLRRHIKARFKWANVKRLNETVSTDPMFSNIRSAFDGFMGCQVFYGCTSHNINVYGIKSTGDFHNVYRDFIREHGAPAVLRRDNAKEENNAEVQGIQREHLIKDEFIEPHHPQQNPVES